MKERTFSDHSGQWRCVTNSQHFNYRQFELFTYDLHTRYPATQYEIARGEAARAYVISQVQNQTYAILPNGKNGTFDVYGYTGDDPDFGKPKATNLNEQILKAEKYL